MKHRSRNVLRYIFLLLFVAIISLTTTECRKKNRKQETPGDLQASLVLPFNEPFRPQYHFTPDSMWMNDPNGLFYLDGVYHLFYQFHPYSTQWGPMHWGHAISKDLLHWKSLPIALYPDSSGTIFSGSAVVDRFNTAGFANGNELPVIAAFTVHSPEAKESQGIAYSNDKGMTWTKYEGNPVIGNTGKTNFRDPKVIWHEKSRKWIMVLAVGNHVEFYSSPDLKEWIYSSAFGYRDGCHEGVWECPDLYQLALPDSTGEKKWILSVSVNNGGPNGGSGIQYFIGDFNGTYFRNDHQPESTLWLDYGPDNYAGSTWSDIPAYDGRRIYIGWMANTASSGAVPTTTWRGCMTIPRSLSLIPGKNGPGIASFPVEEIVALEGRSYSRGPTLFSGYSEFEHELPDLRQVHISCSFLEDGTDLPSDLGILLTSNAGDSLIINYNLNLKNIRIDRSSCGDTAINENFTAQVSAPVYMNDTELSLDIFLDRSTLECFVNKGSTVLSCRIFPHGKLVKMELYSLGGPALLSKGEIIEMKNMRD